VYLILTKTKQKSWQPCHMLVTLAAITYHKMAAIARVHEGGVQLCSLKNDGIVGHSCTVHVELSRQDWFHSMLPGSYGGILCIVFCEQKRTSVP
jgi:hypothetical protein